MALPPNGRVILKTSVGEIQRYRGGQLNAGFSMGQIELWRLPKRARIAMEGVDDDLLHDVSRYIFKVTTMALSSTE
ncbi:uncharacterized protein EI90DRAFT_3134255 [Cantharellus anzutake]|uniref:uncharacterized protein n=1 Tax=Cantharellus anzutake TaxID=1750568 RepID=UPI001904AE56|nr:uncharacterized protein EI90DRAFT_3134255 [Cantharellus anzutake]KAF8316737.1 hypothetical protein EI90DRAFT_3134255 [Cantharellus anzutake]